MLVFLLNNNSAPVTDLKIAVIEMFSCLLSLSLCLTFIHFFLLVFPFIHPFLLCLFFYMAFFPLLAPFFPVKHQVPESRNSTTITLYSYSSAFYS
jgi:hypothetical protein